MPGGLPKLVTIIEPGRVATWVWPAARTVMSLPNTKVESVWLALDVDDGDAAADADGAGRRRDGDRSALADLAADQAQHALAGVDRELAGLGAGIEHELVDGELGVGPDRQRRTVEEDEMRTIVGVGGDELVGLHVDADAQHALGLLRRLAERIAVGGRGDADLGCCVADGERCADRAQEPSRQAARRARAKPAQAQILPWILLRGRHGGQPRHQLTPRYQRYSSRTRWVKPCPPAALIVLSLEGTTNDASTNNVDLPAVGAGSAIGTNSCNSATVTLADGGNCPGALRR